MLKKSLHCFCKNDSAYLKRKLSTVGMFERFGHGHVRPLNRQSKRFQKCENAFAHAFLNALQVAILN